eukprot:GAHX01002644.1.p4 GENE.GAHX01002644.1~~GAHX01002644.1.p4  ORF type:complete len:51 (+),score=6.74 GAHX01002644.1:1301-1453(+)
MDPSFLNITKNYHNTNHTHCLFISTAYTAFKYKSNEKGHQSKHYNETCHN